MINLLPLEEQKNIQKLYRAHVVIISMWLLFFAGFLSLIMLTPSYIIISDLNQKSAERLASEKESDVAKKTDTSLKYLKSVETKISKLGNVEAYKMSDILSKISRDKTVGISLNKIEHVRGGTVLLSGFARSRESMNGYVKSLQIDPDYSKVDSPISNLLGNKDIKFSIVLTLR